MSSEVSQKAAHAAAEIERLQGERAELLAAADNHEREARAARVGAFERKRQIAEWMAALATLQVRQRIESEEQLAARARAEAEVDRKEAARLKDEAAAILEKAKAEAKPAE